MERKEFLSLMGLGAGAFILSRCLGGCKAGNNIPTAPSNVNMVLDLSTPAYSALNTNGNYIYTSNGIIVARTNKGTYLAVFQYCSHAGSTVVYEATSNDFYCPSHGSSFSSTGSVTGGPAPSSLKAYSTSLNGTLLTISG